MGGDFTRMGVTDWLKSQGEKTLGAVSLTPNL